MFNRLTFRVVFFVLLFSILLVGSILIFLKFEFERHHVNNVKTVLSGNIEMVSQTLKVEQFPPGDRVRRALSQVADSGKFRLTVIDTNGRVFFDSDVKDAQSMENHAERPEVAEALKNGEGSNIRYSDTLGYKMLYMARVEGSVIIRAAKPLRDVEEELRTIRNSIVILGGLALLFCLFLAFYQSRNVAKTREEIVVIAAQFAQGNYSRRIMRFGSNEFFILQQSLNSMADLIVGTIRNFETEKKRLSLTIETIDDGIAVINSQGGIELSNSTFRKFFSPGGEISGRSYYEIIRHRDINTSIAQALSTREPFHHDEIVLMSPVFVRVVGSPIVDRDRFEGILLVIQDISERKRIEKIKSDLVSNVSHELKTPVTIIKGYLETLREQHDDPAMVLAIIDKAIRNADRQNALINDIIKLNMLENAANIPAEKVEICEVVDNCLEILRPKLSEKNIALAANYESLRGTVAANRFLAENIFYNLIDNGINYNVENGRLEIRADSTGSRKSITIADKGIGIPPESIDRIFERFYRVDQGRSRNSGGTGLGLAIVKHSAELLGWQVSVTSGSEGTTFLILL